MKVLLYCNKQKPYLEYSPENGWPYMCFDEYGDGDSEFGPLNGYIVAEAECLMLSNYEAGKKGTKRYILSDIKVFDDFDKAYLNRYTTFDVPVLKCKPEELCKVLDGLQTEIVKKR